MWGARSRGQAAPADRGVDKAFFAALLVLFAAIMAVKFDLWRHDVLISDWVFMKNILWNSNLSGDILYSAARFQQHGYPTYLNEHFSPLLVPLAFLYKLTPFGDVLLLALQGGCPCLVAIALRAIGLQLLADRRLAALMGLAFAFNPAILQPAIDSVYGFHSDSLSPPLIALAAWAFVAHRWGLYFVAVLAALLVKENVPAYGVIGGCLLAFSPRHRRLGLATAALSAAVFLVGSRGLPLVTGLPNRNVGYAEAMLGDLLALKPALDYSRQELHYALRYGGAFLPAVALWPFLAMIAPDLLAFGRIAHANLSSWHIMPVLAMLGVLAVIGSSRWVEGAWIPAARLVPDRDRRLRLVGIYWLLVTLAAVVAAPVDLWIKHQRLIAVGSAVDRGAVTGARAAVPRDAGVATTTDIETYFAHRRIVFTSLGPHGIEYVVINQGALADRRCAAMPEVCSSDRELIGETERRAAAGRADQIFDSGGIRVYRLQRRST